MNIFLIALLEAVLVVAIMLLGRFTLARKIPYTWPRLARWSIFLLIFNFLIGLAILYFAQPALTGPYGGWQWVLWPLTLTSLVSLFSALRVAANQINSGTTLSAMARRRTTGNGNRVVDANPPASDERADHTRGKVRAGIVGVGVIIFMVLIVNPIWAISTTWFDGNAKALAHIPNVIMESPAAHLPPTDTNHIVLVSQDVAAYKGQQVLGQNGKNLGSTFHVEEDQYALQSVNHHLYWVAPLVYNNVFTNLSNSDTPGFVAIDAENPDAEPQLHVDPSDKLHYVPGALLNQDLIRHVYLSGYTNGNLVDPTLEVDDSWKAYFTLSLMQPSRGFTGDVLAKVLLVDPQSGNVTSYAPQDVPSWVDRVVPADTVSQYLSWWGQYANAPWFNPSGSGQQSPSGDPELVYNSVDDPVWLVPMTSSASSDTSSTGVFLFNTHKNEAHFYPLSGLGVGDSVTNAFKSNPHNIRGYSVSSIQLYQIFGEPTWVAIFVQSANIGATFQAIGLVDASDLNGANVQMESSKDAVLADYQQWLENHNVANGGSSQARTITVSGTVKRIAPVNEGTNTVYYIWLDGQSAILTANLSLSAKLPLVQPGDIITGTYLDTGNSTQTLIPLLTFDDTTIQLGATATPGGTPTPTPTP
jgi:hypothetical protein